MNQSIFLVVKFGGEFEDKYERVLGASLSPAEAHLFCLANKETYRWETELIEKATEFRRVYENTHTYPSPPSLKDYPRWPAGLREQHITVEMRAERNAIKEENARLQIEYNLVHDAWRAEEEIAVAAFIRQQSNDYPAEMIEHVVEHGGRPFADYRDAQFRVDTVPMIDEQIGFMGRALGHIIRNEIVDMGGK